MISGLLLIGWIVVQLAVIRPHQLAATGVRAARLGGFELGWAGRRR
ncbi:hypothetical protein ACQP2U_18900 [Nocardia sp. CA-084685]